MELTDMLVAARANLWRAQQRLKCFPRVLVSVNGHGFYMDLEDGAGHLNNDLEPYLKIYIEPAKLVRLLNRDLHFNNLEVSGDVMFDRCPNIYNPDVHTLMCFFHLPRAP